LRIGKLRHYVAVKTASTSADSYGEEIETFATALSGWASIEPVSGQEIMSAQQQIGELTHKVRMRHNSAITVRARVYFGSRILEIVSVRNFQERGHWVEMMCKEII